MDDPDLTASIVIFGMDYSSAHIRGANVVPIVAAARVQSQLLQTELDGSEPGL
jgi:hypothetical protein